MDDRFHVSMTILLADTDEPSGDVAEQMTALTEALLDLEECDDRIVDPSVGADLARHSLDVDLLVDADNAFEAMAYYMTVVRTAIHQVGGRTPGWEHLIRGLRPGPVSEVRPVDA